MTEPYKQKQPLLRDHIVNEMSIAEIAEKYDTHWGAIKAYLGVHYLDDRKPPKHLEDEMAYRDKEVLEVLYLEAGMNQEEDAEWIDASQSRLVGGFIDTASCAR
ncbi:hypothetical protein [Halalkalicoccus ordinarius]|uniref:hypothetical protein n=1 Tax=Halalkalicoccus ordinarius TaxID=3116651 RepID=UPI00300F19F0